MPIHSYDPYFYSYLASGEQPDTFKNTPGLPDDWRLMPDQAIARSRGFFTVKPLFVALTRAATPAVGILRAPFLVSTAAYFCLGWVLWFWLAGVNVRGAWRVLAASLLMFTSVVTDTARQGTPDMLCAALLVAGAWLLLSSTKLRHLGALLLLISIFGRTDSIVFGGALLLLAAWRRRISLVALASWSAALVLADAAVASRGYPYTEFVHATLRSTYLYGLTHNFARTELAIYVPFIFLGALALKAKFQPDLVLVCFGSWIIRYLLLPHLEVRYLLAQAIILGVVAAAMGFSERSNIASISPKQRDRQTLQIPKPTDPVAIAN